MPKSKPISCKPKKIQMMPLENNIDDARVDGMFPKDAN